ncbi:MAG: type II toxin-antitoxin system VapC family toxin [Polyangiaceae bacterium]|nr:type II toxin-antitoxin system VapC family toxin [Polyangiaceae bacterium]
MRVLLDTHALLWALEGGDDLSPRARRLIESASNEVLVSVVSAWEIAVKREQGRLSVPDDLAMAVADAGFLQRLVRFADCERLASLPAIHRDPFDRMLVCQALEDGIPLVTKDEVVARYPLQTIW